MMNTLGPTLVSVERAIEWAREKNAHQRFIDVAPIYWQVAPKYNVPAEIAYAQAAKETNYGKFTGIVPPEYHNWCGLKVLGATGDTLQDHKEFPEDWIGITAHIQHLAKYGGMDIPIPGDNLFDPRAQYVVKGSAPTLKDLGGKWAPSSTYGIEIENLVLNIRSQGRLRILVAAGHENIGNITSEKIGQDSANNLRGSTGALGREAEYNSVWANKLCALLSNVGIDGIRLDSIYHGDYSNDADLVIVGHCDGVTDVSHMQWCMASAVISGNSTNDADAKAEAFIDTWYSIYPSKAGIRGNGPITNGMVYYYGGWYRTANTPMVLIEHGILGAGNVWRTDFPNAETAAQIDFEVIQAHFGNVINPPIPETFTDPNTGKTIGGGFYAYYKKYGEIKTFGRPITNEIEEAGLVVQYFEKSRFEWIKDSDPENYDVRLGDVAKELLELREKLSH
jgi:hypothetical protein